jgi:hypothetical protein
MNDFSPKRASETEVFTVDFAPLLEPGEAIIPDTVVWTIAPVDGVDASASTMIVGAPSLTGTMASQMIGGGVPGLRYAPICTVETDKGQTLVLPEFGQGQLEITL